MEYLLLCTRGRFYNRQYVVPSFFDNIDCNKRGQTSRVVVGVQVPEGCDSKENLYNCSCYLGFVPRWFSQLCMCFHNCVSLYDNLNFFLHKNFSLAASLQAKIHVHGHASQSQPSQVIPLNIDRYRKGVHSALWVQVALIICYLPHFIAESLIRQNGSTSSVYLAGQFTVTLVLLNSSLNPLLYCWKIREVRQAVKDTLRRLFCSWA